MTRVPVGAARALTMMPLAVNCTLSAELSTTAGDADDVPGVASAMFDFEALGRKRGWIGNEIENLLLLTACAKWLRMFSTRWRVLTGVGLQAKADLFHADVF